MLDKIKDAINHGFSAIPWLELDGSFKPRKFKEHNYPIGHNAWNNYNYDLFSIRLDDCILIDIDGNKEGANTQLLLSQVCELLNLDEFDLELAEFQTNDKGDSLHYLFKRPTNLNTQVYQHSNDGRSIKNVDFKTGNQLVHIKKGKSVNWCNKIDLPELTLEQYETLFSKTKSESDDCDDLLSAVNAQPDDSLTDNDVQNVLDKIDPTVLGHDEWFRIGLGISHQYNNSDKGKSIFKEFSKRTGEQYDEDEIDNRWPTFKDDSRTERVTFKSVSAMVHINERQSLKKTLLDDDYRLRANEIASFVSESILKELGFDVDIDRDTIQLMLKGSFWNANQGKINMTNNDDELVIFPESKASEMLITRFGQPITNMTDFITHLNTLDLNATDVKRFKNSVMSRVVSSIQFNSQGDSLTYSVDMFTDRTYFDVDNSNVTVNFKYNPLKLRGKHYRVECEQSVMAYKKHFPECDELLDMIVASRFASSRKKAYVWLKCPSDWGKDVFRNALGAFHFEMSVSEVEKALDGSPVGKSPRSMFRAFAMVTNEFKKVKSELKQLEDDITVAAKYQLETTVPLYTKLFMSAEGVDSLIGEYGVEAQFANRFSMIKGVGKMSSIPEFQQFGNTHFVNAVTTYITDYINLAVENYRQLGIHSATTKGDQIVESFHEKYGLKYSAKTIDDNLPEMAEDIRAELVKRYQYDEAIQDGVLYIKSSKSKIQDIIYNANLFTVSERHTVAHKTDDIIREISNDKGGIKVRKVNGKSTRCLDVLIGDDSDFESLDDF